MNRRQVRLEIVVEAATRIRMGFPSQPDEAVAQAVAFEAVRVAIWAEIFGIGSYTFPEFSPKELATMARVAARRAARKI